MASMNSGRWGHGSARPSGAVLPLVLRRKLQEQQETEEGNSLDLVSPPPYTEAANAVFSAQELEERMWRASVAMVDIQKQLARGEETYFEETNAHGNLYRGWDAFADAKDVGTDGAPQTSGGGGSRRIPADNRWFSGSCRSVSRNARPAPLYNITSKSVVTSTTTTPNMSVRSESTSPYQPPERVNNDNVHSKMRQQQLQDTNIAAETKTNVESTAAKIEEPVAKPTEKEEVQTTEKPKDTDESQQPKKADTEIVATAEHLTKTDSSSIEKEGEDNDAAATADEPVPEKPPGAAPATATAPASRRTTRKRKAGD